ncbi:MAG: hypothetical protein Aurels2KO_49050 [Aureliella sp.]
MNQPITNLVCLARRMKSRSAKIRSVCGLVLVIALSPICSSKEPAQSKSISGLVAQLGDRSFRVRETASLRLLQLGPEALDALQTLPPDSSRELMRRAQTLASQIIAETFDATAAKFLSESNPEISHGLPAWEAFRDCVGSSRSSKLLFVDAVRQQRSLMQMIDVYSQAKRAGKADPVLRRAVTALAASTAEGVQRDQVAMAQPELGDFTALLLAVSAVDGQAPVSVSETLDTNVHRYIFVEALNKRGYGTCLTRLLASWIPKTHPDMAQRVMQLSLQYDIEAGVDVARRNLSTDRDLLTRTEALRCVAQFGDETDLPKVRQLLDDQEVLHSLTQDDMRFSGSPGVYETYSLPPGMEQRDAPRSRTYIVLMGDLALATAAKLAGDNPLEYFPGYQVTPGFGINTHSIATPSDEPERRRKRIELFNQRHPNPTAS